MNLAIIGGGPAGLRAAEIASAGGATVTLYEAKPSVGRKFLVAGRGGLNLSKAEPPERFATRYTGLQQPPAFWPELIASFPTGAIRAWAAELGVETFAATTGRVYPREMKAAPLLRRWVERLRIQGVQFAMRHRWVGFESTAPLRLQFATPTGPTTLAPDAAIFALGGGSWPETGSDGGWVPAFRAAGVEVASLEPANCGWELPWPAEVLAVAEGQPLKNVATSVGAERVRGELMVTRYGLEGGALYQLGHLLRAAAEPTVTIDFRPDLTTEALLAKLGPIRRNFLAEATTRWRLPSPVAAILAAHGPYESAASIVAAVKAFPLRLQRPRPIAEAISSAGGVRWPEVDEHLMLRKIPGAYLAGEMLDWEAPTGGYLIHGSFATGAHTARAALSRLHALRP